MRPRIPLLLGMVAVTFALAAGRGSATIARAVTFDEKVEHADAIVVGKCIRTTTQWDANHRWILTYATFQVEQSLKGTAGAEITLVLPGGTVGGIRQESVGIRPIQQGEEHVVFVRNTAVGPTVLDFDQGNYDIRKDDHGNRIVVPTATGAVLVDTQRGMATAAESARPIEEFRSRVRASIERRPERMELIKPLPHKEATIWDAIGSFRALVILALLGIALSAWQFFKK